MTSEEALEKLKKGNSDYLTNRVNGGDISKEKRHDTAVNGQHPYAVIIGCADSRVIPEAIFNAGIGELFVIRGAGNVIDDNQLGSIDYAVDHLGVKLVVVLGHSHCGAVDAAMHHTPHGHVKCITDIIKSAIGGEEDESRACRLNVMNSVKCIKEHIASEGLAVVGAVCDIENGAVEYL